MKRKRIRGRCRFSSEVENVLIIAGEIRNLGKRRKEEMGKGFDRDRHAE